MEWSKCKTNIRIYGAKVDLSNQIAQDRFYDYELSLQNGWEITTLEGGHIASINDFIIKGIKGEPHIFEYN